MRFRLTGTIGPVGAGSYAAIVFMHRGASFPWRAGVQIANYPSNPSTAKLPNALTSCFITNDRTATDTHTQAGEVQAASFEISVDVEIIGTDDEYYRTTLRAATPFGEVTQVVSNKILPMFPLPTFCFHCEGPAAAIGAVQIECRGSLRDYADWTDLDDFSYPTGTTPTVSGGLLTGAGSFNNYNSESYIAPWYLTSPDWELHWTPLLHGPAILQALAGYPVWRWRWQRNAATTTAVRHAAAVCERNGGDGIWEEQAAWSKAVLDQVPTGLAAWTTDDGHVWTVSTTHSIGRASGTLAIWGPTTGWRPGASPSGAMTVGENGWDPVATRLWPSNDALIVWIDANYNLAATRCPYYVSTISRVTDTQAWYRDDEMETVSVGFQALATGGIWNDDTGRLYLSYLDLDGVTQLITSDDGGETWAASE